jgi:hypothetical protein
MRLGSGASVLNNAVTTVFKFFFLWQLQVKFVSCCLELPLHVVEPYLVKASLEQTFLPLTINFVNQK